MHTFNQWGCALALALGVSGSAMASTGTHLQPGQTVNASFTQAQQPIWTVQLKAGDLVQGRLQGDASLRLFDAQGQPLRLLIDGQDQPREFIFIAERDGAYSLRAEALASRPQAAYALSLKQVISASEQKRTAALLQSPTLRELQQQLAQGATSEGFWQARQQQGTPMVEAVAGQPGLSLVTFLWRGARHNVKVFGAPSGNHDELQRLSDSDVWFRSYLLPASARLELPAAPTQPWVAERPGVARGSLERQVLSSKLLGNQRDVYLYRPAQWQAGAKRQGLLVLFDAHAYTRQVPTPTILDNLIADGLIPRTAALIIANPSDLSRQQELPPNPQFARFMAEELMPWARQQGVAASAQRTVVAGSSYGGLASAYMGLAHPELFGNVLSMSGSYWWGREGEEPGWLTREYVKAPKQPLRFYLQSGLFEGPKILDTNRHLRDVLLAKGYPVEQVEYPAGHDYLQWRGSLPCGLISLIGKDRSTLPQACLSGR